MPRPFELLRLSAADDSEHLRLAERHPALIGLRPRLPGDVLVVVVGVLVLATVFKETVSTSQAKTERNPAILPRQFPTPRFSHLLYRVGGQPFQKPRPI